MRARDVGLRAKTAPTGDPQSTAAERNKRPRAPIGMAAVAAQAEPQPAGVKANGTLGIGAWHHQDQAPSRSSPPRRIRSATAALRRLAGARKSLLTR